MQHGRMVGLPMTPAKPESVLTAMDALRADLGVQCQRMAVQLYAASDEARIEAMGVDGARCMCLWEDACDAANKLLDAEQPIWYRLQSRGVIYDNLAAELGAGNVQQDSGLCDQSLCDCPFYDADGRKK